MVVRMNKTYNLAKDAARKAQRGGFSSILDRFQNQDSCRTSPNKKGWDEETCTRMTKLAAEDHSYVAMYAERERYANI